MPNAKPRASPPPPARAEVAEPLSPTTKVLIAGGAVVAGVAVLSVVQAKGGIGKLLGLPTAATTAAAQQAALAAAQAKLAVPTQAGVTFRSGSVGGFIPIPFDKIISSVFSIFQPSKAEAAQITAPEVSVSTPSPVVPEILRLAEPTEWAAPSPVVPEILRPEEAVLIEPDGTSYIPDDQWVASEEFYQTAEIGKMEIGSEYTEYWW
jgi:hypothetical protein